MHAREVAHEGRSLSGNYQPENRGKDRPARTPHVAFVVALHYRLHIFLFSKACLDKYIANPTASPNTKLMSLP